MKGEDVGLIVRAISFQDFRHPMWSWSKNVTDGQTDRRTTCDCKTALCTIVHHVVILVDWSRMTGWEAYYVLCISSWLIEVNASPSLTASSKEDYDLKYRLLDDVLNVIDLENRYWTPGPD